MTSDGRIQITIQDDVTVVRFGEEFESLYESVLTEISAVRDLADSASPPLVVIDLSHTKYFGSAFIGFLITMSKVLSDRGGRLALSGLTPFAQMALETTKSDSLLGIFETVDAAVADLTSARQ